MTSHSVENRGTALVTGASSGIGRALALELASHGYSLAITGRDESALTDLANECRRLYGTQVTSIAKDLVRPESSKELAQELARQSVPIDLLVNNAGFTVHGAFARTNLAKELDLVQVQIRAFLELTKLFLPGMIERRRGGILNIASVYSYSPVPFQTVYGACKSFILSFSNALAEEVRPFGIQVTTVCPGIIQTAFRTRAGMTDKESFLSMSAETLARHSYRAFRKGKVISVPGLPNKLFVTCARLIPRTWTSAALRKVNQLRGVTP